NTRVYIDIQKKDALVTLSMKNISKDPLNIPVDELMERFVRGDSSRHTEGSGLGLNIAQSLIKLQKGRFTLDIDGDMFKAILKLPAAEE
ncbi:MAG: sensor histidine kinase, partial [Anaerotignum sp.]|nr:sensor histidine kinase [Anaerotignum sp.]